MATGTLNVESKFNGRNWGFVVIDGSNNRVARGEGHCTQAKAEAAGHSERLRLYREEEMRQRALNGCTP